MQTIAGQGLFRALYSDRGSHSLHTPGGGSAIDCGRPTQVGWALAPLGIEHIAADSPEARGHSERAFSTHQQRLPRELARAGITTIEQANHYLEEVCRHRRNAEFTLPGAQPRTAFVPFINSRLPDILCKHPERVVGSDNRGRFEGHCLQIPADSVRHRYVKRRVRVHGPFDHALALFLGPRLVARNDVQGALCRALPPFGRVRRPPRVPQAL